MVRAWLVTVSLAATVLGRLPTAASDPLPAPDPSATEPAGPEQPYVDGVVLVGYEPGVTAAERAEVRDDVGTLEERLLPRADLVELAADVDVAEAIATLADNPAVAYVEPDYLITPSSTSDDPLFSGGSLWGMYGDGSTPANAFGSQAAEAWALGATGSSGIAVGIIDEGVDISHPDLAANIWTNPGEIAGDGIDNDGNGYVDDVHGWDFYNDDNSVYDAVDGDTHGTHVAGTIGAVGGNGIGVAGVNWAVTLVPAKFMGPDGGTISDAIAAINYLAALKVRAANPVNIVATNNSWGSASRSTALRDAIVAAGNKGILFVAAAGNSGNNADSSPEYPAAETCSASAGFDCILSVASITSSGGLSSFSNYGSSSVDLGAPGSSIISTYPGSLYASSSGTSMATPHVTGAIALCASLYPQMTAGQLRSALIASVAPTASLGGMTVTGGRLDIGALVARCEARELTVSVVGSGSVSSSAGISCGTGGVVCTASTAASGTLTLSAKAATGWKFSSWTGCTSVSKTTCTVSMTTDRTVTATFSPITYTAKVTVSKPRGAAPTVTIATSGGTSWSVPACATSCQNSAVAYGTVITVTANFDLATGVSKVSWSGCDSRTTTTCTVTVNGSESIAAKFTR